MKRALAVLTWCMVGVLVMVRWHNWQVIPEHAGFDTSGQSLYLRQVVVEHRLPGARDGWMDYQPPGYYLAIAPVAWGLGWRGEHTLPAAGRLVSALASLGALGAAFFFARRVVPGAEPLVVLLLACLPADLMGAAMLSGFALATLLAGLFLERLASAWYRERIGLGHEAVVGVLAGLAFLVRLENVVLLGCLVALWGARLLFRRPQWRDATLAFLLSISLGISLTCAYLLPNLGRYDRPFNSSFYGDMFPYFYADVDSNLNLPGLHSAHWFVSPMVHGLDYPRATSSLWGMTYLSLWWDHMHVFLPSWNPTAATIMAAAGLIPVGLFLYGAWRGLHRCRDTWMMLVPTALGLALYVAYQIRLPQYSCVKANYCYPLFLPAAALVAYACRNQPGLEHALRIFLILLAGAVAVIFWLPGLRRGRINEEAREKTCAEFPGFVDSRPNPSLFQS